MSTSVSTRSPRTALSGAVQRVRFGFSYLVATATSDTYTLSLHDALPISCPLRAAARRRRGSYRSRSIRGTSRRTGSVTTDRKSTRLNSSHVAISYAVFCLKKKTGPLGGITYRQNNLLSTANFYYAAEWFI